MSDPVGKLRAWRDHHAKRNGIDSGVRLVHEKWSTDEGTEEFVLQLKDLTAVLAELDRLRDAVWMDGEFLDIDEECRRQWCKVCGGSQHVEWGAPNGSDPCEIWVGQLHAPDCLAVAEQQRRATP